MSKAEKNSDTKVTLTPAQARVLRQHHQAVEAANRNMAVALGAMLAEHGENLKVKAYDVGDTDPHVLLENNGG